MSLSNVLELLSGIAMFLFGMALMGDGLKKVAGNKLEIVLYKLSNTPIKGILLGTGVTAVIQSSSATSVMVVGFVNSGMMKVKQAMGVIMGSIIGTSITGWIIALSSVGDSSKGSIWEIISTDTFTAVMAVIGILLYMFSKKQGRKQVGGILLGFAVLMYGINFMSTAVYPLRDSQLFINFISKSSNPIIGIIVGTVFTAVIQSASAAVGILQALAVTGAISFDVALPLIMGIAIGAAVPVLLSALGANAKGKRTAFTYLFVDLLGVILVSIVFYVSNMFLHFDFMSRPLSMVEIAELNTVFRIINVVALTPFIGILEKLMKKIFKDKYNPDTKDMDRLEDRFLVNPKMAIEQTKLTMHAMAEKTLENFNDALSLFNTYDEETYKRVGELEETIDQYEDKLGTYLVKIMGSSLDNKDNKIVSEYLHAITDFERISDHAKNIAESFKEKHEKNIEFSEDGYDEICVLISAVEEVLALTIESFIDNNLEKACRIEPLEQVIDDICDEMKSHHIERIRDNLCTYDHGFVFNDLLTDMERVSDHCSNVAVAVIETERENFNTHEYIDSIKQVRGGAFEDYYNSYSKKYVL